MAFLKRSPNIAASVHFLALHQNGGMGATNPDMLCRMVGENYQPSPEPIVNRHLDRLGFSFYHTDCATRSLKTVVRVLAFFRSVHTFSLQGIPKDEALEDADIARLPMPLYAFSHLQVKNVALLPFISLMQSKPLLRNIETLDIEIGDRSLYRDPQALGSLLVQI